NGTVNFNAATGQAEYTPNGFPQVDQFTYRICGNSVPITCDQATVNIIPGSPITFPDFGPYCQGDFAPPLPNSSLEGVSGNWFPPAISTGFPGTIEYTFYPDPSTDPTVCYGEQVVEIEVIETLVPEFNIPDQFCQGDVVPSLPTLSDNFVSGTWDPSTINNQITRTYTFTPDAFFCADEIDLTITITPQDEPMFSFETQYCTGGTVDALPTTSDDGITGTWNPTAIDDQNSGTYTFTPDGGQCATTTDVMVTIGSTIDPTFTLIDEYCIGSTTEILPTTSENGITGTWSPTTIDNQNSGSYTFTPDGGQCGEPFTLDVTISTNIIPGFNFQQQYCAGATVDLLPGTSTNGISGTWSPSTIDNQASGMYTFTPDPGQCSDPLDFSVTIDPVLNSEFSTLTTTYCSGEATELLPGTSDNGITGTWSPATVDNTASGNYTFTPDGGQCANPFVLDVTIDAIQMPAFTITAEYCQGEATEVLPTTSDNGLSGTWSPAIIDDQASGSYTFTPDPGLCADPFVLDVTINPTQFPSFTLTDSYCQGDVPAALPTTSDNGVSGSWSPALIDNQASGTYTFTPDGGQCAVDFSFDVTINAPEAPTFNLQTGYCENAVTDALPATSDNGIPGTWSPASIDNQASGTYTFTPDAGQCAQVFTFDVSISAPTVATFNLTDSYCQDAVTEALPLMSDNGINGSWNPAIVDNQASGTYTFTPDGGQCASGFSFDVTIDLPDDPSFALTDEYCQDETTVTLPNTSDNGINGSWSPAIIDNQASGTYTFTPDPGLCANAFDLDVTINPSITPDFTLTDEYCQDETTVALPGNSDNGLTGSWSPAVIDNQASGTYTFTPDAGQCGLTFDLDVTINPTQTPEFAVQDIYCQDDATAALITTSDNGLTGSWNPMVIDNQSSGTYTFTPDVGQCAVNFDLDVTVNPTQTPSFTLDDEYCQGESTDLLPTNSDNGLSGMWSPANIDNQASGLYTFSPDDGQCGEEVSLSVTINPSLIPVFTLTDTYCQDEATDALPNTSDNGLAGTWSPAIIDNQNSASYLFTPDPLAQCVSPITLDVTVNELPQLDLTQTADVLCQGESTASINLDIQGSGGYTIIWNDPDFNGQQLLTGLPANDYDVTVVDQFSCTSTGSLTITEPTALQLNCQITQTATPNNSDGIIQTDYSGGVGPYTISWTGPVSGSTASADPQTDISDLPAGDYEITIEDQNGCTIVCNSSIADIPCDVSVDLTGQDPSCSDTDNGSLSLTANSSFGIEIIDWNVDVLDGQLNSNALSSGVYDVVVTDSVGCVATTSITLTAPQPQTPQFDLNLTYCQDEPTDPLPLVSQNGITGTWSPSVVDAQTSGIYSFTPDPGLCADPITVDVEVVVIQAAIRFLGIDCNINSGTYNINFNVEGDMTDLQVATAGFQLEALGGNRYLVRDVPAGSEVTAQLVSAEACISETDFPLPDCFCANPAGVLIAGPEQIQYIQGDSVAVNFTTNLRPDEIDSIFWSPATDLSCSDCLTPWVSAQNSTQYTLTVIDTTGCRGTHIMNVLVDPSVDVFVPTAFSPNEDGINDRLTVFAGRNVARIKSFLVFDRWGNIVYNSGVMEPNDPNDGWDGKYRGQILTQAVFVYVLDVETIDGRDVQFSGETMLIR
ncbi:MAG: gliding motility-associated C-terminal domain-containing protein, partial [Bacteroidota bacterium]